MLYIVINAVVYALSDISKTAVAKLEVVDISRKVVLHAERGESSHTVLNFSFINKIITYLSCTIIIVYNFKHCLKM